jgi:3,4-dihydroxy 2-butanone 4-phosphate synthase/GTP cyclohydrolase II
VTPFDAVEQLALVYGDISGGRNIPVRLHRENVLEDVFGNRGTLDAVFDIFKREGKGVLVYLQEGTAGVPASQLSGERSASAEARAQTWLDIGLGAQILRDLGISRMRLMTNNQRKYDGIADFGLQILERVPLTSTPHAENEAYLRTKQLLMGHTLGLAMQQ